MDEVVDRWEVVARREVFVRWKAVSPSRKEVVVVNGEALAREVVLWSVSMKVP